MVEIDASYNISQLNQKLGSLCRSVRLKKSNLFNNLSFGRLHYLKYNTLEQHLLTLYVDCVQYLKT